MSFWIDTLHLQLVPLGVALVVSLCVTGILSAVGVRLGGDKDSGVQKFHSKPTSRLGGVGIFAGLFAGLWVVREYYTNDALLGFWLMVAAAPVFLGGLVEDLTHAVTPRMRLLLAVVSGCVVFFVLRVGVFHTDIALLDWALAIPGTSLLLTLLVVAGFINATNIIDGFHGLAAGTVLIMLCGLAGLAFMNDDALVLRLCLLTACATLGFLVWNWPFGKIFLGDGGAYLLGLWVVELGLMLPYRSEAISPMAPVLVGIYPLVETVYSMYRRKFLRSHPINHPDALHLHTLIYRRLMYSAASCSTPELKNKANARVAMVMWGFAAVPACLAVVFAGQTLVLLCWMVAFSLFYINFYKVLVRFEFTRLFRSR